MDDADDVTVTYAGKHYYLQNHSVAIVRAATGEVVFNSSVLEVGSAAMDAEPQHAIAAVPRSSSWTVYQEAAGGTGCAKHQASPKSPIEQLHLTGGGTACSDYYSDYLWYTTTVPTATNGAYKVSSRGAGGTIMYHYVDGKELPTVHTNRKMPADTLEEQDELDAIPEEFSAVGHHQAASDLATVTLQILSVGMGLSNGGVGPKSVKGLQSASVNGVDLTNNSWNHAWMMPAEEKAIWTTAGSASVAWKPATEANSNSSLTWFRSTWDLPASSEDDPVSQVSYAMDMSSASKGVVFVNGFELGRYYITPGGCHGKCAPPIKNGHCYMHWSDCDEPTQTLYHIPTPVLKPTGNEVVFFEEKGGVGLGNLGKIQMVKLTAKN